MNNSVQWIVNLLRRGIEEIIGWLVSKQIVRRIVRYVHRRGLECEPEYLRKEVKQAETLGLYIGDYLVQELGWFPPQKIVDSYLLPRMRPNAEVVELGPGTGRYARLVKQAIPEGRLHLFEKDKWWSKFLATCLFANEPNVIVHECDGYSLRGIGDLSVDLVYAKGVFTYLPTMVFFRYLHEASRVLKYGGSLVFNFHDLDDREPALTLISEKIIAAPSIWQFNSLAFISSFLAKRDLHLEEVLAGQGTTPKYVAFNKVSPH